MTRVLIISNPGTFRDGLTQELSKAGDVEIVATASDQYSARDKILALRPDVVVLDLGTSTMKGLSFVANLMRYHPLPVVVLSSQASGGGDASSRALATGAAGAVYRQSSQLSAGDIAEELAEQIRLACGKRPAGTKSEAALAQAHARTVVAIGGSTGATKAIESILVGLPAESPGILIVQHMPQGFTASFAERLNGLCPIAVREARPCDPVLPGTALVAPGDQHMALRRKGDRYHVEVKHGPAVHRHRPSVDVLFHSVARCAGREAVGVILTGMGADGARGLLAMRNAGARTLAQDEASCAVFGMPREAIKLGAAEEVVPLHTMPRRIMEAMGDGPAPHQATQ